MGVKTRDANGVEYSFESEEILGSIALLTGLRDFCLEQDEVTEGRKETAGALTTAVDVMSVFWCEHFGGEKDGNHN